MHFRFVREAQLPVGSGQLIPDRCVRRHSVRQAERRFAFGRGLLRVPLLQQGPRKFKVWIALWREALKRNPCLAEAVRRSQEFCLFE